MPYKNNQSIPSSPSFKKITLSFVVVVIVLLVFIVYFSFAKATIIITLGSEQKTQTFDLTVSSTSTESDLAGQIITKEIEISQKFEVANFEEKTGVATGKIRIINNNNDSQQLIKTTRFLTPDNLLFRLKDNISIPAGKEIAAEIYADAEGAKYNIQPTKFTIPGLAKNLQEKIYGISDEPMAGGMKKIGVLTQADIDQAQKKFTGNLKQNIKTQLLLALAPGENISDSLIKYEIKEQNIKEKIGDQVENFTLTAKVLAQAVIVNEEQLLTTAKEKYKEQLTLSGTKQNIANWQTNSFVAEIKASDAIKNNAILSVSLTAEIGGSFDLKKFDKKEIAGFDKKGVEYYFSQFAGIKDLAIKFWPFWVRSVPAVSDKIIIEVK